MFSSEMVVDSQEYIDFVVEKNRHHDLDIYKRKGHEGRWKWFNSDLDAFDMESYGFFMITEQMAGEIGPSLCFTVRGISDGASDKGILDTTSANRIREIAVENAVKVAFSMVAYFAPIAN